MDYNVRKETSMFSIIKMKWKNSSLFRTVAYLLMSIVLLVGLYIAILLGLIVYSYFEYRLSYSAYQQGNYQKAILASERQFAVEKFMFEDWRFIIFGKNNSSHGGIIESEFMIADLKALMGNYRGAKEIYDKLTSDIKKYEYKNSDFLTNFDLSKVNNYMQLGYYNSAIEYSKNKPELKVLLLDSYIKSKQYAIAEQILNSEREKELPIDAAYINLQLSSARYFVGKKQYLKAEEILNHLIKITDKNYHSWYKFCLANIYNYAGDYKKSKEIFRNLLNNYHASSIQIKIQYSYAYMLTMSGEKSDAENFYKKILELTEDNYEASPIRICTKYNLGLLKKDKDMIKDAEHLFKSLELTDESYFKNNTDDYCRENLMFN